MKCCAIFLAACQTAAAASVTHTTPADFKSGNGDGHVSFTALANGEVALQKMAGSLGAFTAPATLPFAMAQIGAFASDTHIYMAGMADNADNPHNNVYSAPYNGAGLGAWTPLGSLPYVVKDPGVGVWRNHVYIVGGVVTGCCTYLPTSLVVEADIIPGGGLGPWNYVTPLPIAVGGFKVSAAKGYLFLLTPTIYSAPILADGSLGAWNALGSMPTDTSNSNFGMADGYLWTSGGENGSFPFSSKCYSAKINDDGTLGSWVWLSATPLPLAKTWYNPTESDGAGKFFNLGGRTGLYGPWATREVYSSTFTGAGVLSSWSTEAALPTSRTGGAVILAADALWYLGGVDNSPLQMNSIYRSAFSGTAANAHSGAYENGFDLGAMYPLSSLSWNSNNAAFLSCQVRCADASKIFGPWSSPSSSSPLALTVSAQYVEYRFDLSDPGSGSDLYLHDVNLDYGSLATATPTLTPAAAQSATPSLYRNALLGSSYIFPSPVVGDTATLAYCMASPGRLRLDIWNERGELADTIEDVRGAGPQFTSFSVSSFAAGIYLYRATLSYDDGHAEGPTSKKFGVLK